ncbi:hypothetical protein O6P43_002727 [Quillaja saponaria]|uniref:DUF3615 domain-containing protein n=1 Tax=Quillaja saponaria TaxID=32244 RepID=A0AAD7VKT8_QUISA|nr:hypothetical protein O6P43_002727 [Quillaja saponaria]
MEEPRGSKSESMEGPRDAKRFKPDLQYPATSEISRVEPKESCLREVCYKKGKTCVELIEYNLLPDKVRKSIQDFEDRKGIQDEKARQRRKEECDTKRKLDAEKALIYYNEKMGTNFAFEKMVDYSSLFNDHEVYMHMNFMGRKNLRDPSPKLFFAELDDHGIVTTCTIVEPGNPLFRIGCGNCHPNGLIYHPLFGYQAGRYQYTGSHTVTPYLAQKKHDFWCSYNPVSIVTIPDDNEARELTEKTTLVVEKALECYNKRHNDADFKFVALTSMVRFVEETDLEMGHWIHINFKATSKTPECTDPTAQLFFAELLVNDDCDDVGVEECCIVDPEKSGGIFLVD